MFDAIGIPSKNSTYGNHRLSYYISNKDYYKNAATIISLYGNTWGKDSLFSVDLPSGYEPENDKGACPNGKNPNCMLISKENAETIFELYNFPGKVTDYFNVSSEYDNIFAMDVTNTTVELKWNGPDAGVIHNVVSEYINTNDIKITDKQIVSYYNDNGQIVKIKL